MDDLVSDYKHYIFKPDPRFTLDETANGVFIYFNGRWWEDEQYDTKELALTAIQLETGNARPFNESDLSYNGTWYEFKPDLRFTLHYSGNGVFVYLNDEWWNREKHVTLELAHDCILKAIRTNSVKVSGHMLTK